LRRRGGLPAGGARLPGGFQPKKNFSACPVSFPRGGSLRARKNLSFQGHEKAQAGLSVLLGLGTAEDFLRRI
jgi:hypothetical protein